MSSTLTATKGLNGSFLLLKSNWFTGSSRKTQSRTGRFLNRLRRSNSCLAVEQAADAGSLRLVFIASRKKKRRHQNNGKQMRNDYFFGAAFLSSLISFLSRKRNVVARHVTLVIIRLLTFLISENATLVIFTIRGRFATAAKKFATLKYEPETTISTGTSA